MAVPEGVLSILPGPGPTTGVELVKHPLVRKVDITVRVTVHLLTLSYLEKGGYQGGPVDRCLCWGKFDTLHS
jgi:delta 1-pyrroline-5-carboxylate dehydrogenase